MVELGEARWWMRKIREEELPSPEEEEEEEEKHEKFDIFFWTKETYKDLNKLAYQILLYRTGQISREELLKRIEEACLYAPKVKAELFPELPEMMKELYDLIDNEAWAHVADKMEEIQEYLVEKVGENDIFS